MKYNPKGLSDLAIPVLCDSVRARPAHWGAWLELSSLVKSRDKLAELDLPDHWCRQVHFLLTHISKAHCIHLLSVFQVFMAHTYLELQQNEQAVRIYDGLSQAGLAESTYIMAQV